VICIDRGATVSTASKLMREEHVDELLVTQRIAGCPVPAGILSARDIVVHVIGVELDPEVFTVGDVLSCNG
jgi:CBS domain-containing protein